jgi:hypothetical protein
VYLETDLEILDGNTLTIESEVYIAKDRKIIVRLGAKLIVDGGTLTNFCGERWQGIYVEGQSDQPQVNDNVGGNQGVLILDDALIENAWEAVNLFGYQDNTFTTTGGIIIAENETVFRNNIRDVTFKPYSYTYPNPINYTPLNLSKFNDCTFERDEDFIVQPGITLAILEHVYLDGVRGITFTACEFIDDVPGKLEGFQGSMGIHSIDSYFKAQGRCDTPGDCTSWDPTVFDNLLIGINASDGLGSSQTFTIDRCLFDGNHFGILNFGVDYATIVRNEFLVGIKGGTSFSEPQQGATMFGATEFTIEDNDFIAKVGSSGDRIGVTVINSGEDQNQVRLNDFQNLTVANLSEGLNRGVLPQEGLFYSCNVNEQNQFDFFVADESNELPEAGIRPNQGSLQLATGNSFTTSPPDDGNFTNTIAAPITYFHVDANDAPADETDYTEESIALQIGAGENECETTLSGDPEKPKDRSGVIAGFALRTSEYDSLHAALRKLLLDDGDTPARLSLVSGANVGNAAQVQDTLLNAAPYSSETVLWNI